MLFVYLILFCSLLFGLKVSREGYFDDFLDRGQTDAIKGFFVLMVLVRHCLAVIRDSGFNPETVIDSLGFRINYGFGQLVVAMFFFYSGYGVMEAIKRKGKEYLDNFPRHRILTTLLNFDIAVACFIILNLLLALDLDLKQIAWSLIGWESVGNSNWFIFVILYCYLSTWASGKVSSGDARKTAVMTALLVLAGEASLSFIRHGQTWWYNTLLCYPAGMFLSLSKEKVIPFVQHNYLPVLLLSLTFFLFMHFQEWIPALRGLTYNVQSIAFACIIVIATMKVKTGNRFLNWAGSCVFPIYIYQRLPMNALKHWPGATWITDNPLLFLVLCATVTGLIAYSYKYWRIQLR